MLQYADPESQSNKEGPRESINMENPVKGQEKIVHNLNEAGKNGNMSDQVWKMEG